MALRQTTRVGGCLRCGVATVMACTGCERFLCPDCEPEHNEFSTREARDPQRPS